MYRKNVQVYVYNSKSQKILMLRRIPEKAGYWQPVCGGIESGESAFQAAARELKEETGIHKIDQWLDLPFEFTYDEPKDGVMMRMTDVCYVAKISGNTEVIISDEHDYFQWIYPSRAHELSDWEPIQEVCKYIEMQVR